MLEILFIICFLLILLSYFIYPIFIILYSKTRSLKFDLQENYTPSVSIIIAAHNEEVVLEDTIDNFMNLDYPKDKIEIIIGSDCSTDRTNDIIKHLEKKYPDNVKGLLFTERRGKSLVLNDLAKAAKNEIIVFSDANTMYKKDALKEMVKYYQDPKVGGVCGRLILINTDEAEKSGNKEDVYWDMETKIKIAEGKLGILIGANGGIYSVRKELYEPIPSDVPVMDDLFVSLNIILKKYYLIYNQKAQAVEYNAPDVKIEYRRKIRNNKINVKSLVYLYKLLLPKYGIASFAFFAHKVIRWFSPILFMLLLILNYFLISRNIYYLIMFVLQIIFYFLSFAGFLLNKVKINISVFAIPYYIFLTHLALLIGLKQAFFSKGSGAWEPTKRIKNQ